MSPSPREARAGEGRGGGSPNPNRRCSLLSPALSPPSGEEREKRTQCKAKHIPRSERGEDQGEGQLRLHTYGLAVAIPNRLSQEEAHLTPAMLT